MRTASRYPAVLTLVVLVSSSSALAFEWRDLWQRKDQQAHALLESGNAEQAAQIFADQAWRGVSHYEAGNYEQAISEFSAGNNTTARYNQGVAEVMGGEYQAAIDSFESVLAIQPEDADAAHNLEIARALAQQQQQQNQNNDSAEGEDQPDNESTDSNERDQNNEAAEQPESNPSDNADPQSSSSSDSNESDAQSQSPTESEQSDSSEQTEQQQSSGELSEEAPSASGTADEQAQQAMQEAMDQQIRESDQADTDTEETQSQVPAGDAMSEENQAAEQWLRRIPDDPSQLLRNKIKLNHLLEHPDVGDTAQPW